MAALPEEVLDIYSYWVGTVDADGVFPEDRVALWFYKNDETDTTLRTKYSALIDRGAVGELDTWTSTLKGTIALIILLDQFPRNIYRGTPRAFATDSKALAVALTLVRDSDEGPRLPNGLTISEKLFSLLPLEHAEDKALQQKLLAIYDLDIKDSEEAGKSEVYMQKLHFFRKFAYDHKVIIDQFGRYPHRNAILGRESTPEEVEFVATHKGF